MEDLHGNPIPSLVELLEHLILDSNIGLNGLARQNNLFIATTTDGAHEGPVGNGCGQTRDDEEEDIRLKASAVEERQKALEDIGNNEDKASEV